MCKLEKIRSSFDLDLEFSLGPDPNAFYRIRVLNHVCDSGRIWIQIINNEFRSDSNVDPAWT